MGPLEAHREEKMKSYECEPAPTHAAAVVLFILVAIGIWAVCGHFFYNQAKVVSSPYQNIHAAQVITHFAHQT